MQVVSSMPLPVHLVNYISGGFHSTYILCNTCVLSARGENGSCYTNFQHKQEVVFFVICRFACHFKISNWFLRNLRRKLLNETLRFWAMVGVRETRKMYLGLRNLISECLHVCRV